MLGEDDAALLVPRPPIVTVMGHVDHGKTSLLDAIRSTTVAAGERGGITQHIGASEVVKDGKKVVFLDTPGHEAFTAMRARGAQVTDIAVIVVAADDGVMPQTLEAISHARAAKVPIIVALNKIDKPDANPDRVKTELAEANVVIEEYGGDVPLVPVSAKARIGLEDLLDMILLVADLQELKANPKRPAVGTIIEAEMDKGRGPVATVVVQTGTLRIGDVVVVGKTYGKVKALENAAGKRTQKVGPSSAAVVLGLAEVPEAGDILRVVDDEKTARGMVEEARRGCLRPDRDVPEGDPRGPLQPVPGGPGQGAPDHPQGRRVGVARRHHPRPAADHSPTRSGSASSTRGPATSSDTDILLASASNAIVVGFNTKIDPQARRTAEAEKVDVRLYDIIYKLTDDIEKALTGMLEPEIVEWSRAGPRFARSSGSGSRRDRGLVRHRRPDRPDRRGARLPRRRVITTDRIESLRRFRDDVREVDQGYECGIELIGFHDLRGGRRHRGVHPAVGEPRTRSADRRHEPAHRPGRRAPSRGDRGDPGQGRPGPAHRVRHGHRRRDDAGPAPCEGVGQRDRRVRGAGGDAGRPRPGDGLRAARARESGSASGASRHST